MLLLIREKKVSHCDLEDLDIEVRDAKQTEHFFNIVRNLHV